MDEFVWTLWVHSHHRIPLDGNLLGVFLTKEDGVKALRQERVRIIREYTPDIPDPVEVEPDARILWSFPGYSRKDLNLSLLRTSAGSILDDNWDRPGWENEEDDED